MSTEVVAVVVSALGIVLTLGASILAGGAWIVRRIDSVEDRLTTRIDSVEDKLTARIDAVEVKLTARIDSVEEKLTARIDSVESKLSERIDALAADMTDVKVSIARLEGPPRHLLTAAR